MVPGCPGEALPRRGQQTDVSRAHISGGAYRTAEKEWTGKTPLALHSLRPFKAQSRTENKTNGALPQDRP